MIKKSFTPTPIGNTKMASKLLHYLMNKKRKSFRRTLVRGFSLIEVVIACTILILFLTAGVILYGNNMKSAVIAKHRLEAVYLANAKLEQLTATRDIRYFQNSFSWAAVTSGSDIWHLNTASHILETFAACNPATELCYRRTWTVGAGPYGGACAAGATDCKVTLVVDWNDFGTTYNYSTTISRYLTNWQQP